MVSKSRRKLASRRRDRAARKAIATKDTSLDRRGLPLFGPLNPNAPPEELRLWGSVVDVRDNPVFALLVLEDMSWSTFSGPTLIYKDQIALFEQALPPLRLEELQVSALRTVGIQLEYNEVEVDVWCKDLLRGSVSYRQQTAALRRAGAKRGYAYKVFEEAALRLVEARIHSMLSDPIMIDAPPSPLRHSRLIGGSSSILSLLIEAVQTHGTETYESVQESVPVMTSSYEYGNYLKSFAMRELTTEGIKLLRQYYQLP